MKTTTKFLILLTIFGSVAIGGKIQAINITVTGSWSETIDASDLQAGPGSDLNPTYVSATDQIIINITGTNTNWRVGVRKVDTNWHSDLRLGVRRTGDGIGPGSISGGGSWVEVIDSWTLFFTGSRVRLGIEVQLGFTGMSVQIPPDTYITTVIYGIQEI